MKKKILITLLVLIPFISILLVVGFRGVIMPTNEEIVEELRDIKFYKTNADYIFKNSRGEEKESTTQYYSREDGVRVEFGEDLVKLYKDNKVEIIDNKSNTEYQLDGSMDIVYSLSFMKNILSCPIIQGSMKEDQEEWGDVVYIQFDVEIFKDNDHLDSARVFINKDTREPIGIVIYDKKGEITLTVIYEDFEKMKEIDDNLL